MEWNGVSVNIERNDLGSTVWITLYAVRWKVLRTIRSWRIPRGSIGAWNWILSSEVPVHRQLGWQKLDTGVVLRACPRLKRVQFGSIRA